MTLPSCTLLHLVACRQKRCVGCTKKLVCNRTAPIIANGFLLSAVQGITLNPAHVGPRRLTHEQLTLDDDSFEICSFQISS
jgi:hypothetical protein